jgi:hypothetical protein
MENEEKEQNDGIETKEGFTPPKIKKLRYFINNF